jgi:hypothetical protein
MTAAAISPVFGIVLVKYFEGDDDLFVKNAHLVAIHADDAGLGGHGKKIPEYEHELLKKDWMPTFMIDKGDREELNEAKKMWKWMKVVIPKSEAVKPLSEGGKVKEKGQVAERLISRSRGKRR